MADLLSFDKRWQDRKERWVKPARPLFSAEGYGVEVIAERDAKAFICGHHYSGSYPAARLAVGLLRKDGPVAPMRLVGVAVFSVPMSQHVIPKHTGLAAAHGVELGRFVCLPEVAFNGETWFLVRAFQALRAEKTEIRGVVSYADPVERRTLEGLLCKAAHAGSIYQGSNAAYVGRGRGGPLYLAANGAIISRRVITKIQAGDSGHEYGARQIVAVGAEPRRVGEEPRAWLDRVLVEPTFRRLNHPGNFTYVFGLDRETRRAAAKRALPYPKLPRAA